MEKKTNQQANNFKKDLKNLYSADLILKSVFVNCDCYSVILQNNKYQMKWVKFFF